MGVYYGFGPDLCAWHRQSGEISCTTDFLSLTFLCFFFKGLNILKNVRKYRTCFTLLWRTIPKITFTLLFRCVSREFNCEHRVQVYHISDSFPLTAITLHLDIISFRVKTVSFVVHNSLSGLMLWFIFLFQESVFM